MENRVIQIEHGIPPPLILPPVAVRRSLGLCPCGKEPLRDGYKYGEQCAAKQRADIRVYYRSRRAQGFCGYGRCSAKTEAGHSMCPEHLARNDRKIRALLDGRVKNGLCRRCGKHPILGTATWCLLCYGSIGGKDQGAPKHPLPGSIRKAIRRFWRDDRIKTRRGQVEAAIPHLRDERLRRVLALRHGLIDGIDHTLEDVGREFTVTRERIRQLESKAYRILRGLGVDISFRKPKELQRPSLTEHEPSRHAPSEHDRRKATAHRLVAEAVARGEIMPKLCERKGCTFHGKALAHHEDYDKPLEVMWLCPPHHAEAHGKKLRTDAPHQARYDFPSWLERARQEVSNEHYNAQRILEALRTRQLPQREVAKATGVGAPTLAKIVRGIPVKDETLLAVLHYVDSLESEKSVGA